jgi:stalled ribosome alternative rescue factor ArfA
MKKKSPKKRNSVAKILRTTLFKQRIVKSKKGKGSYKRKPKINEEWSGIV